MKRLELLQSLLTHPEFKSDFKFIHYLTINSSEKWFWQISKSRSFDVGTKSGLLKKIMTDPA